MSRSVTERLGDGVRAALAKAGLPEPETCAWEIPRQPEHGDYATNVAMALARAARRPPRQVAEAIAAHFPPLPEVERVEVAGPGFVNVFLTRTWCAEVVKEVLAAGPTFGRGTGVAGRRIRLEFVSANPTGPLVIVNARAAAVGDALARLLRAQGAHVITEYYVNDAGNQFEAFARSFDARVRQALGEAVPLPEGGYPGEYLIDLARQYLAERKVSTRQELDALARTLATPDARAWLEHVGRWAVARIIEAQRRVLADYGVEFDVWTSEQRDVRDAGLPDKAIAELAARGLTREEAGALWFRSVELGDDKDRVLRRSNGEPTYFAVDLAYHHAVKFKGVDRVIDTFGPDHHGHVGRLRAAMEALGHPRDAFDVLLIQLVTLLRDGQPVRMSKRRGEFVLMEELLEEVGRDAARFTFLMRRHDSPLEFDLAVATRETAENPVYYVQYAHARICSIWKQVAEQRTDVEPWAKVSLEPLVLDEELALMKRLAQYPDLVAGATRALEPHRVAYWLYELAGLFHPYYKAHRVIQADPRLMNARLALCTAIGQVIHNGLDLLGVSAPEQM